ncbi:MAG: EamA family transporter [Acidimicrobiia bacterium]|nr:EamA family transporter [Acidimicrobiia bacterium]
MRTGSSLRGLLLALSTALVSGAAVYINGRAVRQFPSPTVYTTGKNLVAALLLVFVLLAVVRGTGGRPVAPSTTRHRLGLATIAVIGGAVPFLLFFEGLARASSTDAAFLHKTLVVWASILAVSVLHEHIGPVHVVAVAALVAGHAALAGGIGLGHVGTGEVVILLATLCWAVELIVVKRLVAEIAPATVATARLTGGVALLLAWLGVTGRLHELVALDASQAAWLAATGVILALFVTLWFHAIAAARVVDVTAILVLPAAAGVGGLAQLVERR